MNTRNKTRSRSVTADRPPTERSRPWRAALAISLLRRATAPRALRQLIDQQVGGIEKLIVPAEAASRADTAQENRCREPGILIVLNEVCGSQSLA